MLKTLAGAVLATVAFVTGGTLTAFAADISVPLDTVIVDGVVAGDQVELTVASSGPFAGATCDVRAVRGGDGAPHAGNDLIVTSGASTVTLVDVEREPSAVTNASGPLTLDEAITVELRMGPEARFDGDIDLELTCAGAAGAAPAGSELSSLPVTGADTGRLALLGGFLLAAGGLLVWMARPSGPDKTGHAER